MANGSSKISYFIGITIMLILGIIAVILIYLGLSTNNSPGPSCTETGNCGPSQICSDGYCIEIYCSLNSDCRANQECAANFCYQSYCEDVNDCLVSGTTGNIACVNNLCTPSGMTCTDDSQCWGGSLKCSNNVCVQCINDTDCPNGLCSNGICISNCLNDTDCVSGQSCYSGSCCPTNASLGVPCGISTSCAADSYCVNSICTCKKGNIGDICTGDGDCSTNKCLSGFCANSNATCVSNFGSGVAACGSESPYCVNGRCSTRSIGAPCSCTYGTGGCDPNMSCMVESSNIIAYCVNNICSETPGWVGAKCGSYDDCSIINGIPNCNNGRCV